MRCVLAVYDLLLDTDLAHDKARPVFAETDKIRQPHWRERKGVWCAPRISNPMAGAFGVCGEFDSHPSRFYWGKNSINLKYTCPMSLASLKAVCSAFWRI